MHDDAQHMADFAGRKILVTGASGGIGRALVSRLAALGATLSLADLDTDGVDLLAAEIRDSGGRASALPGDLGDTAYCDALPARARRAMGGLTGLVNNAGLMRRGAITAASDEDFAATMRINVEAPFRLCRAAIPLLAADGGGAIVNVASCWGLYPGPNHPLYCMSKSALASLTQCLGRDHAHQNIRVNAVCPNEVDTPMLRGGFAARGLDPERAIEQLNATVPLGRIAAPEEIADVIVFLLSAQARYLCGALVEVNGGKPVY